MTTKDVIIGPLLLKQLADQNLFFFNFIGLKKADNFL
jgi:hypothetical protein